MKRYTTSQLTRRRPESNALFGMTAVHSSLFMFFASPVFGQVPPVNSPAAAFEQMFERFAENAGPLAPMFGKVTPEQQRQLDSINVSVADEREFGQRVLEAYTKQLDDANIGVSQLGKDVTYVQQLLKRLKPQMQNGGRYARFEVSCIESDSSDAFSIPGGRILVTKGLLTRAPSEAAVVGVLAHELSHLDRGHQLIPLKQSQLARQPLNFQDSMFLVSLVARPFRPEQESEADRDATAWMMAAGYEPRELAKLLMQWDRQQEQTAPWMEFVPGFVKSHPDAGKRARVVLQIAQQNRAKYPDAKFVGVQNLRQRSPRP
jgi:predicted Zn-dependent protease